MCCNNVLDLNVPDLAAVAAAAVCLCVSLFLVSFC